MHPAAWDSGTTTEKREEAATGEKRGIIGVFGFEPWGGVRNPKLRIYAKDWVRQCVGQLSFYIYILQGTIFLYGNWKTSWTVVATYTFSGYILYILGAADDHSHSYLGLI
jgi:hypothetical protein